MPVTWSELKKGLKPEQFHMGNALARIRKFDDPWKNVLSHSTLLTKCGKLLSRKFGAD
jgi:DNA primase